MRLLLPFIAISGLLAAALPDVRGLFVQLSEDFVRLDLPVQVGVVAGVIGALGFPGLLLSLPGLGAAARSKARLDDVIADRLTLQRRIDTSLADIELYRQRSPAAALASGVPGAAAAERLRTANLDALLAACENFARIALKGERSVPLLKQARACIDLCTALGWKESRVDDLGRSLAAAESQAGLRRDVPGRAMGSADDAAGRVQALINSAFKALNTGDAAGALTLSDQAISVAMEHGLLDGVAGLAAGFSKVQCLTALGRDDEALVILDDLCRVAEGRWHEHPQLILLLLHRAHLHSFAGRKVDARRELNRLMALEAGSSAEVKLLIRMLKARVLIEEDLPGKALEELDQLIPPLRQMMGERDMNALAAGFLRAQALMWLGRHADAIQAFDEQLARHAGILGDSHSQTLALRSDRARVLLELARFDEAEAEVRNVLAARLRTRPKDHVDVKASAVLLAQIQRMRRQSAGPDAQSSETT